MVGPNPGFSGERLLPEMQAEAGFPAPLEDTRFEGRESDLVTLWLEPSKFLIWSSHVSPMLKALTI